MNPKTTRTTLNESTASSGEWTPKVQGDPLTISAQRFYALVADFTDNLPRADSLPPLGIRSGWHTVTPQMAEEFLARNRHNRKLTFSTVVYYAQQMVEQDWVETGQPLIFDDKGRMIDGQNRLWAGYLSLTPFRTFIVADVPARENLFAYIDNGRPRTAKDALWTASHNGTSPILAGAIHHAYYVDNDAYSATAKSRLPKFSPAQVLRYSDANPELKRATRLMSGEYRSASDVIHHRDVAAYVAYRIVEVRDDMVLDEFMTEIGSDPDHIESEAVRAFRIIMERDSTAENPMAKHMVLGTLIKTFNAWQAGETTPAKKLHLKLSLRVNEAFPAFHVPDEDLDTEA